MSSTFESITPRKVQRNVELGYKRLENFRNARMMFLRQYTGQYYDKASGEIGTEALNLIFNAVRTLVPNIVMNFPTHKVSSNFLASAEYGEMLSMALAYHDKQINIKSTYREAIVDAIFTLGILKTGIAESDSVYVFDENSKIDTGSVYTEKVDFDNYVVDPNTREHLFKDALWEGDKMCVVRQNLLDSGLYDNEIIENLPAVADDSDNRAKASHLSRKKVYRNSETYLEDEVEIVELWVPGANALITVPGCENYTVDKYLRVDDYYGPSCGPYTKLALTPPTPGNSMPVAMVGIWHDLHVLSNSMAHKVATQAERQKDVMLYRRNAADDAQEIADASDGEGIAVDDPSAVNVLSLGGQQQSNEIQLAQLGQWFNMMAGNPQAQAGVRFDAGSATEAKLLQGNANITMEDMKDLVYTMGASEARRRAWYMHTDPFIEIPLIRREQIPAQYKMTESGPVMEQGERMDDVQIYLTPEARNGDWLDFTFDIEPESMGRVDSNTRLMQAFDFATKILPAAMQAAQIAAMLQIPFNVQAFIISMAKNAGIKGMDQFWYDPTFQARMAQMMMSGPSPQGSQGTPQPGGKPQLPPGLAAIIQNGQPGQVMGGQPSEQKAFNQAAQGGVTAQAQSDLRVGGQQY